MTLVILGDTPAATGILYDEADRSKPPIVLPSITILIESGPSSTGTSLPLNPFQ
jgi:hypothetical protein